MAEHVLATVVLIAASLTWSADVPPVDLTPPPITAQELEIPPRQQLPDPDLVMPSELATPEDDESSPEMPSETLDAADDVVQTTVDAPVRINYAENDTYPDSVLLDVIQPVRGVVAARAGDDPHLIYTPSDDIAVGDTDPFFYTVCSTTSPTLCDSATVTVEIIGDQQMAPEITDDGVVAEPSGPTAPAACQEPHTWGGHRNGRIPDDAMAAIGDGHRLQQDAASAFIAMRDAAAADGVAIPVTDSYRSYAAQERVRQQKGHLVATATPGTSVHGWGKALDLDVRDQRVRSWLEEHSRAYAWVNPPWAKRPGKGFEPWHYEYYGLGAGADNPQCDGIGTALVGSAADDGASSDPATTPASSTLTAAALPVRALGLGGAALVAIALAAAIFARDLRRGRVVRRPPRA